MPVAVALSLSFAELDNAFGDVSAINMTYFAVIAVLIGANLTLTIEYIRRRRPQSKNLSGILGLFGGLAAILGYGCAACCSLLATWVLGVFGAGWLITLLPFCGEELRVVGITLLILSAYLTIRSIHNPAICPLE